MEIKEYKQINFAEHEIYIPFNNDDEALDFSDWWGEVGKQSFIDWRNKN